MLETPLTDLERHFIEDRLTEEKSAIESLVASTLAHPATLQAIPEREYIAHVCHVMSRVCTVMDVVEPRSNENVFHPVQTPTDIQMNPVILHGADHPDH